MAEEAVSVLVHKFPSVARTTEVHLVRSTDSVALRPMTLEEAIKEAHFRDRDVFVFPRSQGQVMVLHRKGWQDGTDRSPVELLSRQLSAISKFKANWV